MPRVSRNQVTVSLTLGVDSTPWPMRCSVVGDLASRIRRPLRRSGSPPVFTGSRSTLIGATASMPWMTSIW